MPGSRSPVTLPECTAIDSAVRPSAAADASQQPFWHNRTGAEKDRSPRGAHRDASDAPRDGSSSYRFLDSEFGHSLSHTCALELIAVQRLGVSPIAATLPSGLVHLAIRGERVFVVRKWQQHTCSAHTATKGFRGATSAVTNILPSRGAENGQNGH